MNFSPALPTFVITLREGVEAALVVGIVFAYLKKAEKTALNPWVYGGIAAGLLASLLVGIFSIGLIETLGSANREYEPVVKPLLNALFSVVAIAMLSWMLIWMTRQAKLLKTEVESAIKTTLTAETGAGWGIFGLIFFAVLREGFETVLFLSARFEQGWIPIFGAAAGIITAVGIGVLLFQWGVKINLRLFFQVMGVFLLLIVAGLVVSALAHFDAAISTLVQLNPQFEPLCIFSQPTVQTSSCLLGSLIWDTSRALPEKQFPGIILHTLFGYEDRLYFLQAFGYIGFLVIVGGAYLQTLTGWGRTQPVSSGGNASPQQD
ncbi:FTR1 family protein [Kovacikia minuta CCNUW1]|uniref:FTR1 family iron permease n=1 Tax=Kovacikia minuta TaxID=2931930 RepID=UPI001CC91655|nr:FTR1 family protein [Kovacikia minuta]UBF26776.1 FTR1 family protein [Kovacikia minuta CCNUW1]